MNSALIIIKIEIHYGLGFTGTQAIISQNLNQLSNLSEIRHSEQSGESP